MIRLVAIKITENTLRLIDSNLNVKSILVTRLKGNLVSIILRPSVFRAVFIVTDLTLLKVGLGIRKLSLSIH